MQKRGFFSAVVKSRWLDWQPANCFLQAASLSDCSPADFKGNLSRHFLPQGVIAKQHDSRQYSLFLCLGLWHCKYEEVIHSPCLYWRALLNKHYCHKSKQSGTLNAQKACSPSQEEAPAVCNVEHEIKKKKEMGQQCWLCDVQRALDWSARPKLKPWNMSPYCYHLHTGFFKPALKGELRYKEAIKCRIWGAGQS